MTLLWEEIWVFTLLCSAPLGEPRRDPAMHKPMEPALAPRQSFLQPGHRITGLGGGRKR